MTNLQIELAFAYPTFGFLWVLLLVKTDPLPPIKEMFSFFIALVVAMLVGAMSHVVLRNPLIFAAPFVIYGIRWYWKHAPKRKRTDP